jgi:hypothetical protein
MIRASQFIFRNVMRVTEALGVSGSIHVSEVDSQRRRIGIYRTLNAELL